MAKGDIKHPEHLELYQTEVQFPRAVALMDFVRIRKRSVTRFQAYPYQ